MRSSIPLLLLLLPLTTSPAAHADERTCLVNYDLLITYLDGSGDAGSIQQIGVRLSPDSEFHGDQFGNMDYFLTISDLQGKKGQLTVEVYQFESRKKESDVVSEFVTKVDFTIGAPARLQGKSDTFEVDLAFSIVQE